MFLRLLKHKFCFAIYQDPILTAFELSAELRQLAFAEYEFKSEYLGLRHTPLISYIILSYHFILSTRTSTSVSGTRLRLLSYILSYPITLSYRQEQVPRPQEPASYPIISYIINLSSKTH